MTSHDASSIEELAAQLTHEAQSMPALYLGFGIVIGLTFGFALGGDTVSVQRLSAISYGLLGAFIGWSVGKSRQTSLQLQALIALEQIEAADRR